ncbi:MAG: fibronectin type III domain-containing protein [Euryarchaeota archaeon]|nr:fibronectin type III domain-containing protein [Euryarchaeota archaeon]
MPMTGTRPQPLLLVLLLITVSSANVEVEAGIMETATNLPRANYWMSSVWTGEAAYIFGGNVCDDTSCDGHILRYDPGTGDITTMTATLPTLTYAASAVWTGDAAYVFGGTGCAEDPNGDIVCNDLDTIVRYDPADDDVALMNATLPTINRMMGAVWSGEAAYIFGGYGDTARLDTIVRYDPATDNVTVMETTLPTPAYAMSAVWNGEAAYIYGGRGATGYLDTILRYEPRTDTLTILEATLPNPNIGMAAVWSGQAAYLFGGHDGGAYQDSIFRHDPTTTTVTTMTSRLLVPSYLMSAVWNGDAAYVFGGYGCPASTCQALDTILQYDPQRPGAPPDVTAVPGDGIGEIVLTWSAPDAEVHPITGYTIYRGNGPEGLKAIADVDADTTRYLDGGLVPTLTYHYHVVAHNTGGYSSRPSETASAEASLVPRGPMPGDDRSSAFSQHVPVGL